MNRWMHVMLIERIEQVRGERLKVNMEIVSLKPCHVSIVQGN